MPGWVLLPVGGGDASVVQCRVLLSERVVADDGVSCGILLRQAWDVDADGVQRWVHMRRWCIEPNDVSSRLLLSVCRDVGSARLPRWYVLPTGIGEWVSVSGGKLLSCWLSRQLSLLAQEFLSAWLLGAVTVCERVLLPECDGPNILHSGVVVSRPIHLGISLSRGQFLCNA